ncbi:MAG: alanine--tRNA ligase [Candidatus Anstonellales archaeon]
MVNKEELKKAFNKDWEKHYKLDILIKKGFKRQQCMKCKRMFWALDNRQYCADPSCIGYEFIGNPPSNLKLDYVETWKKIEKYFVQTGHTSIKPFPTVARWRDDLYFTIASINDFQPYVVNGELDPIANPLIVPQPCIRFSDISNVGITGRHYTNFVMIGQHAFNNDRTGLFYWKEQAIEHDINYLKSLGINEQDLVFHEDVWAGGGNFGPSIEYFSRGLELGNCVFMQYEELANGESRELKTKVIDMGAGLSRLCWITHGSYTSYEIVLGKPVYYLKDAFDIHVEQELFAKYSKYAGYLNVDEVEDIEKAREDVAKALNIDKNLLFDQLEPLQAIYAIADHTLTLLFTITDGMMPSNSGGGYNLRILARRIFAFEDRYGFNIDYGKVLELHMEHLKGLFDQYKESIDTVANVITDERKKYVETKNRAKARVINIIKKAENKAITTQDLITLYKSDGIPPEYIKNLGKEHNVNIQMPGNFYELVREPDSAKKQQDEINIDVSKYDQTYKMYYDYDMLEEFEATVIGVEGNWVILDKTMFYPEGGGQIGDTGWLDDIKVVDTKKIGNVIIHKVERPAFKKGQKVIGKVDWERRIKITRHHTATHLITAAARLLFGKHIWQAGAKKEEDKAHIDLTHYERFSQEQIFEIEKKVNEWVMQDIDINAETMPRTIAEEKYGFTIYQGGAVPGKELRIISIKGIDAEACGGTHHMLKRTGQIGFIKIIKRETIKDGVERLVFKVGQAALDYLNDREQIIRDASNVFKVPSNELVKTCERFFNEWKKSNKKIEKLEQMLIKTIAEKQNIIELDFEPSIVPEIDNDIFIITEENLYIVGKNASIIWDKLKDRLMLKGGGKGNLFKAKIDNKALLKKHIMEMMESMQ